MPVIPAPPAPPGTNATALDLIKQAMRLNNVLASGEELTAAESNDALATLNRMLDSWQTERLCIYAIKRTEFSFVIGQQVYTLGTGGDFNVARPARIERVGVLNIQQTDQPIEYPCDMVTEAEWALISLKNLGVYLPSQMWDDGAFPKRNLSFWPVPAITSKVALYTWVAIPQFINLSDTYSYPPGYLKAIVYNLAVELSPEFGGKTGPEVAVLSMSSKAVIKSLNQQPILIDSDDMYASEGSGGWGESGMMVSSGGASLSPIQLSGAVDGVNVTFVATTAIPPVHFLYSDGVKLVQGNPDGYTVSNKTIVCAHPPVSTIELFA